MVDVGASHDPQLGNFDHHQFPKDHPPMCSLSLVLQHLGLYEDARAFCDWLEPAEWLDTRGPKETSRWLGINRDTLAKLNSPIDVTPIKPPEFHAWGSGGIAVFFNFAEESNRMGGFRFANAANFQPGCGSTIKAGRPVFLVAWEGADQKSAETWR